jgi:hypothetical protein
MNLFTFILILFVASGLISSFLCWHLGSTGFEKRPFYFIKQNSVVFIVSNFVMVPITLAVLPELISLVQFTESLLYLYVIFAPFMLGFFNSFFPHYLVSLKSNNNSIYNSLLFSVFIGFVLEFLALLTMEVPVAIDLIASHLF